MTETPHEAPPNQAPPPPPNGWDTDNLKDYRRLRRTRVDRKVAGVAGGLGRHLNIDPTILRVLFVVLVFFGGSGLLLYGALWLFVPEEGTEETVIGTSDSTRNALLIGAAVIAGLLAVGDSWHFPWALVVIGLVVAVVLLARDKDTRPAAPAAYGAPDVPAAPGYPDYAGAPYAGPQHDAPWYPPAATAAAPTRRRRTGPILFGFTLALIALALGALGLYDALGGSVTDAAYAALALAVTGLMLVVGAFFGRAGGLILLGLVAVIALGATAIGNPSFDGDRNLVARPTSAAALEDSYRVPAGRIELDLTDVRDLEELDGRSVELDVNAGEVLVIVPDDLGVSYDADIEFGGEIQTPDGRRDGWGTTATGRLGGDAEASVDLDIDVRFGRIEVTQR